MSCLITISTSQGRKVRDEECRYTAFEFDPTVLASVIVSPAGSRIGLCRSHKVIRIRMVNETLGGQSSGE